MRQDYRDDMGLDESLGLALKVLSKTMDSTTLDSEKRECSCVSTKSASADSLNVKVELATLTLDPEIGLPRAHIFKPAEIDARECIALASW